MNKARFILSKKVAIQQYNKLKQLGTVSFSVKTNPEIAKILEKETDSFFSLHSVEGAVHIENGNRIWFLCQAINDNTLDLLFSKGVNKYVVDNETDLENIINYIERNDKRIQLLLRMKLRENTIFTGRYFVFGMRSDTINRAVKKLKDNQHIEKLGIHFHRKGQNTSEWDLIREISQSLTEDTLKAIQLMNVGGGIPIKYKNSSDHSLEYVLNKIGQFGDWLKQYEIGMMLEPGRFISGPTVKLETEIISMCGRDIIVNASVYNSATDALTIPLKLIVEGETETGDKFTLKGSTPCSLDIFRYDVRLNNPKIGDKIVFLNAGAYNFTTDFCSLPKIETVVVD